jgi:hypothetical protein
MPDWSSIKVCISVAQDCLACDLASWLIALALPAQSGLDQQTVFTGLNHRLQPESCGASCLCSISMNIVFSEMTIADELRQPIAKSYISKQMSHMTGL